jgi:hypothetical protein
LPNFIPKRGGCEGGGLLPAAGPLCYGAGQQEQQFASEGSGMHIDPKECHPAMDYSEHQKTYKLFCKLTAWTIIGVVAVMALLYFFVA